jgi:putative ABC transport system permease protein
MKIILKFILKSIREQKFRTFLIIFSITLSSALFFASVGLSGTLESVILERVKKYIGTADIVIHPNEKSPTWHYSLYNLQKYTNTWSMR